jgi:hypothetical protein
MGITGFRGGNGGGDSALGAALGGAEPRSKMAAGAALRLAPAAALPLDGPGAVEPYAGVLSGPTLSMRDGTTLGARLVGGSASGSASTENSSCGAGRS